MKKLTENQEKLIQQITKEFMVMNESETPKSFADLLINEVEETRQKFDFISSKNQFLFKELQSQYLENLGYLKTECAKLGIAVADRGFNYKNNSEYCSGTIVLLHPQNSDYNVHITVRVPTRFHSKSGLHTWELYSNVKYGFGVSSNLNFMDDFNVFLNKDNFKSAITNLYNKIKN